MSKKQKNETSAKAPVKLTRAEKKEIQAVIRKYKGDGKPHSAQASIPYEAMYQDGVCRVTPRTFSKCIEFTDISYQLAQADTKTAIFENLCDLYNYLDASIHVQFSFINRKIDPKQYAKSFEIRAQGDDFDDIRSEYSDILQDQLVNGNNGLMKRKFMTYTIEADSLKMARARLRRIETDLLGYFKSMGASAWGLDAKERLEVMHSIFHPDGEPFSFDWKWLAPSGLSTKDFIAPSSFRFGNARMFGLGGKYGVVSFLQILSPELSDEMLADFLNTENGIVVNLHVQAIDQSDAIKTVKRKITDLDAMKIQEQKRAVRSGYDMDILPSDLATYGQDAKELLKTLQSRNERMFQLTFLVLNTADTRQKLENDVFWAAGIAQKYNCSLVRLDYQQEQGLMSSLPLGASHIQIERSLTTSSVAVFVPFVTQELFQGGDAMYYGINAKTGNMIMLDRKRARCPNGLKLGTPGSGKSMSCKSEIVSVFLCTPDDVYICDPEAEYYPLVKRLHGQVVKLSPTSKNYVNPLDINLNYSEDENPLALKSDFVLSFCELVMGGKNGLEAIEKTVIDRAVQVIYRPYLADPKPENMPILADLHKALLDQHIPEADRVAQALDLYVSGSLNVFNHRTNIDIQNRIVAFDIKELGKQLKKIGMLIVQDQIWGRVTKNRSKGKATWYFCDEFHLLLREEQTAAFSCEIWKRFRKWGGIPTGATQNVKDLLSSPEIENILENSDFICLLNQASGDRKILAERLNISPQQLRYEFVPYMELHCNLAAMEQEARRPLRSGETLTPEQTAYFNAVLDYVKECRPLLNQGQYHLPEPPQLADFDQSLQDYKKQIEAELEQEAAAAGLTVEEYVASDYEAPAQPNFSIYQVPPGPEGRDFRYRSYEDLQADGLSVDRKNYQLVYTAPLDKDTTLDEIYRRFNIEHPADYKGHSLSTGDIVVFRQDGKQTAYYVDEGADYRQVPEFFAQPEKQLTPDECMTGEQIQTPRGRFYLTDRSREQMEAAGYGFHHQSEDGRYLIMANGTRAFAIPAQQESHIKTAEMSTEQNYNMIDGMMNNAPSMEELEERAKAGEQISLLDVAEAAKAEAKKPKQTRKTTQKQKKPSIRAQLAAAKEEQKKKPPAREKSKEMEV